MRDFKEEFAAMGTMSTGNITPYSTYAKPHYLDKSKKYIKKVLEKKLNPPKNKNIPGE